VGFPFSRGVVDHFAECDDTGGASVNTQGAASAHIVINDEDCVVSWVKAWKIGVDCFIYCLDSDVPDAFPGTNIDASFTLDAFGLVDIDELLGLHRCRQVVGIDCL
jgi:hypothetical protein